MSGPILLLSTLAIQPFTGPLCNSPPTITNRREPATEYQVAGPQDQAQTSGMKGIRISGNWCERRGSIGSTVRKGSRESILNRDSGMAPLRSPSPNWKQNGLGGASRN